MKAILVIDMPTSCSICKADKICKIWNEEQVKFKGYNDRLDGCPLKSLPKNKPMTKADHTYDPWEDTYRRGWNDCLKEIEGD